MTNEVDYLFVSLLAIQMFFFLKWLYEIYVFKNLQDTVISTTIIVTCSQYLCRFTGVFTTFFVLQSLLHLSKDYSPSLIYRIPWCRYITIYLFYYWWVFIWVICQYCFLCTWRIYFSKILLVANYSNFNCMKYCILALLEVSFSEYSIGLAFPFSSLKLSFHCLPQLRSQMSVFKDRLWLLLWFFFFNYLYF